MADAKVSNEEVSNENSTKEFLLYEKTCEAYKDSDEEIKIIFSEIKKLSNAKNKDTEVGEDVEDVELILKRAEVIANETENLLKTSPITLSNGFYPHSDPGTIPQIRVIKPSDNTQKENKTSVAKVNESKHSIKDVTSKRKPKSRPFSAGVLDSKKKDDVKVSRFFANSPKKVTNNIHESVLEELRDTNERVKSLELSNVQLNEDNNFLRKKLEQVNEEKYLVELKITECEKFVHRLSKEYEIKNSELNTIKQNENIQLAELNREKDERKQLSIQRGKDAVVIQDLQRQVKEMEMILKRKHPDSVSALIVASKSSSVEDNKKKLLEERISRLEQELKDKENHFQSILLTLQEKFGNMKQKYESHIIDVERQLMEDRKVNNDLKNKINKFNLRDVAIQTTAKTQHSASTQTLFKSDRASSAVSRLTQNSALIFNKLKEDSYLVATIKGLQAELTAKQRIISKINRETEELRRNLRNLQKEKEVLIHLNPQKKSGCKQAKSTDNILAKMNTEMEAELNQMRKEKETYMDERSGLLSSLKRTNEDLILLKKKRIQDLHTLQLAHEKELMQMNMHLYPLQEEIKLLNRTVEILQDRVRTAEDKVLKTNIGRNDIHAGGDSATSKNSLRS